MRLSAVTHVPGLHLSGCGRGSRCGCKKVLHNSPRGLIFDASFKSAHHHRAYNSLSLVPGPPAEAVECLGGRLGTVSHPALVLPQDRGQSLAHLPTAQCWAVPRQLHGGKGCLTWTRPAFQGLKKPRAWSCRVPGSGSRPKHQQKDNVDAGNQQKMNKTVSSERSGLNSRFFSIPIGALRIPMLLVP